MVFRIDTGRDFGLAGPGGLSTSFDDRLGIVERLRESFPEPGVATSSVVQTETLPAGTVVLGATYTVTALPAGLVELGTVAQVRAGQTDELVVDFGGMRTVQRLRAPASITSIAPWAGTQFGESLTLAGSGTDRQFTEIQTERLLVGFSSGVTPDALAAAGSATVLSPPSDLELLVNGTRAWFSAGAARPGGSATDPAAFETTVDLTAAVRAAVEAAPRDADFLLDVALRSSVPGQLALGAVLQFQRTFDVVFPEGSTRVVDAPAEGVYELLLPLPDDAAAWEIHEVQATVSGALPPLRVLPPDGPAISGDASLVLDPDHAVLVGLPPASLGRFATVSAVRVPLGVDAGGAELAGVLHGDADGSPGDPLPDGQLGPVTLAGGDLDRVEWTGLPLAKERKLAPGELLWVELQLARGRVGWPLALPAPPPAGPVPDPPPLSADAPIRRRLPNGAFRPLSTAGDVPTTAGAIRTAGEAPGGSPIAALELDVAGVAIALTPTTAGVPVTIGLDPPLRASLLPAAFDESGALVLTMTTATPGSVSFAAVRIAYTDGGETA